MAYDFNAKEIFEMAVRIEENGAAFYTTAADRQQDPSDKTFLLNLAKMEEKHKKIFETMEQRLSEMEKKQTVFDPNEESSAYLEAMADAHGGEGNPDIAKSFTGKETMAEIVSIAISLEKESILFYLGIKEWVPPKFGKDKIERIIREEQQHVVQLSGFLKKTRTMKR